MLTPDRLRRRDKVIQATRFFFQRRNYVEVMTPVRQPVLLPESQIEPIQAGGWYLQSSPEQCMKRLLAAGNPQIFQICPCFRGKEVGRLHAEEFTLLEWYQLGWDYQQLMDECEDLFLFLLREDQGRAAEPYLIRDGKRIPLDRPWARLPVDEAFGRYARRPVASAVADGSFDQVLVEQVEPHLGWEQPVFLIDYPAQLGSLARRKADNPDVVERFELYVAGMELANGFSELVDSVEQEHRFFHELDRMAAQGVRQGGMPRRFLDDLTRLTDCAGIALGLERLLMILWGERDLSCVTVFSRDDLLEEIV